MYSWLHFNQGEYQQMIAPGMFQTEGMFTEEYLNAEFIYRGFAQTVISMSLSRKTRMNKHRSELVGLFRYNLNRWYSWDFAPNSSQADAYIKSTTVLNEPQVTEYIVFVGNSVRFYQHFLIDHFGCIAYLRRSMTATQKLVIPD